MIAKVGYSPVQAYVRNAQKNSFDAMLQRTKLENIEDEKRKKAGGGGGGSLKRFDRIAVSFMLLNFLSNKALLAMIKNANQAFLKLIDLKDLDISKKTARFLNIVFIKVLFPISNFLFNSLSMIGKFTNEKFNTINKTISNVLQILGSEFSAQLKKLKEIIDKELEEKIIKLDIKNKMKLLKSKLYDFVDEAKEVLIDILNLVKGYLEINNLSKLFNF